MFYAWRTFKWKRWPNAAGRDRREPPWWGVWLVFALFVLWRLARAPAHPVGRVLTLLSVVGLTAAATAPQPHLNNLVLDGHKHAIAVAETLSTLPGALRGEQTSRTGTEDPAKTPGRAVSSDVDESAPAPSVSEPEDESAEESKEDGAESATNRSARSKSEPLPSLRPPTTVSDKTGHLAAFAVLALLASLTYRRRPWWLVVGALACLSGLIQIVQHLSVTREPDLTDLTFDLLGIAIGGGVAALWITVARRGSNSSPTADVAST